MGKSRQYLLFQLPFTFVVHWIRIWLQLNSIAS